MGHAIVGRSIIPPVNQLLVHKLANERRFVHINASKVLPARGVDCAARGPARASRLSNLLASAGARARTRTNTRRAHACVLVHSPS